MKNLFYAFALLFLGSASYLSSPTGFNNTANIVTISSTSSHELIPKEWEEEEEDYEEEIRDWL